MGGTKLERFLPKNQHTQRKLLNLSQIDFIANSSYYPIPRIFFRFGLSGGTRKGRKKY